MTRRLLISALFVIVAGACAQTPAEVLVVVNKQSASSKLLGEYYARKRAIPAANICTIDTAPVEVIDRKTYTLQIEKPVGVCLRTRHLEEKVLYIVMMQGVPLQITGVKTGLQNDGGAVDSELTLLYQRLKGATLPLDGIIPNPYFRQRDAPFTHPQFPMYMVTRIAAYSLEEAKGIIDKALIAKNRGKVVIDLRANEATDGNHWLRAASLLIPPDRLVMDETPKVLKGIKDVIAYAAWGSNDFDRHDRFLGFQWLPGAIVSEFVSTNARTFARPPDKWNIGSYKDNPSTFFAGQPQTLLADYIHEGATGGTGHVNEPFLHLIARPDFVLPAYYSGRNLADSFYMAIPGLSWQNIVVGDPFCRLQ